MNELKIQSLSELPFDVEEAINQLRVNIGFCGSQIKTIMITSSVPNEGKSFIAIHLWRMLAGLGNRVLLVDCDLRKSELRTKYGISTKEKITGIAHYLSGKVELDEAIYQTNFVNGFFMPVATTIVNPTILLESDRFAAMIEQCAAQYDYVLIDTPPLESVADALQIARRADGVVMVIRSGQTSRKVVINAVDKLKRTETKILGFVLNRVETDQRGSYYYRQYYRNGYYYTKNYSNKKESVNT